MQFLLVLLIIGLICLWITWHITSLIVQLRSAATQLARGNLSARVSKDALLRKDELAALGTDFNYMADQIEILMASQRRLIADISHERALPWRA